MPTIRSNNVDLYYTEQGSGQPLLLIHGWGMSANVWAHVMEGLSGVGRVIAVDLRGHGHSSPGESYTLPLLVDDLVSLIYALDLREVILAGWSLGGQIVLATVPAVRERLAAMVLISSTPKFTSVAGYGHGLPPSDARGMGIRVKRSSRRAMEDFCRNMFTKGELSQLQREETVDFVKKFGATTDEEVLLPVLDTLIETDLRDDLPYNDLPVLVVHGSRDNICPPGAAEYMLEHLSQGESHFFENAGHAPFITRPAEFISVVTRFIERTHEQG